MRQKMRQSGIWGQSEAVEARGRFAIHNKASSLWITKEDLTGRLAQTLHCFLVNPARRTIKTLFNVDISRCLPMCGGGVAKALSPSEFLNANLTTRVQKGAFLKNKTKRVGHSCNCRLDSLTFEHKAPHCYFCPFLSPRSSRKELPRDFTSALER